MPTISLASVGTDSVNTASATPINNNFSSVQAAVNALDNTNIAGGAAIAYSKLSLAGSIINADVAPAAAIAASKLAGYPSDATKALLGDGSWGSIALTSQRKTTTKAVSATVAETDLLNGEFSVAANVMGTTKVLRLVAYGDYKQNSGGSAAGFRFKVKFGAGPTTVIDTGTGGATVVKNSATRYGWRIEMVWQALGATNAQGLWISGLLSGGQGTGAIGDFTTGSGTYGWPSLAPGMLQGYAATAIDTTASQALQLTVINGSATTTDCTLAGAYYVIE